MEGEPYSWLQDSITRHKKDNRQMIGCETVVDWRLIGTVLFALVMFGAAYNALMARLGDDKEGYTALFVALGVGVTITGVAIVSWHAALLALASFAASGSPMIIGSVYRYIRKRNSELERIRAEIRRAIDEQA